MIVCLFVGRQLSVCESCQNWFSARLLQAAGHRSVSAPVFAHGSRSPPNTSSEVLTWRDRPALSSCLWLPVRDPHRGCRAKVRNFGKPSYKEAADFRCFLASDYTSISSLSIYFCMQYILYSPFQYRGRFEEDGRSLTQRRCSRSM